MHQSTSNHLVATIVILAAPAFLFAALAEVQHALTMAWVLLAAVAALLGLLMIESAASALVRPAPRVNGASRAVTIVVSAYLPNEQTIIVETVRHLLALLSPGDKVVLSYRTPVHLAVEDELTHISRVNPSLRLLRVEQGAGKAEQLNEAIHIAGTEVLYFVDADARPNTDALESVRTVATSSPQVVQGRNMIRNTAHVLGKIVAVEFAVKYLVSHYARSCFAGVAYFCGSNAAWSTPSAKQVRFANSSLVEDVEASLRADLLGITIAINPTIGASELAPLRVSDWWQQRVRWAQGWLEVGATHSRELARHDSLSVWKKVNWFYVIYGRRVLYSVLCLWLLSCCAVLGSRAESAVLMPLFVLLAVQLVAGASQSAAAYAQCRRFQEPSIRVSWLLCYAFVFPFYDYFKSLVTIAAIGRWRSGRREWTVTPRTPQVHTEFIGE